MSDHVQSTGDIREALFRAFPSIKAFRNFKENDLKISPQAPENFINLAQSEGLIAVENPDQAHERESAFLHFLAEEEQKRQAASALPPGLGFAGLLRIFWDETPIKSATSLVENLNEIAQDLGMAPVQESMVSRLKAQFNLNTPKKRNFIRLLCFWIGLYASQSLPWNYNTFQDLPSGEETPAKPQEPEGVRLSFIVSDKRKVEWICRELTGSMKHLQLHHLDPDGVGHFERIVSFDISKAAGPSREPKLYGKAVGEALALAHQVVVRWLLAEFNDPGARLAVLISAGVFDTMETNIPLMLPPTGDTGTCIRLCSFARLCARMAEAKVVLSSEPERFEINGQMDETWEVKGFWPSFFEFVPQLFKPEAIPQKKGHFKAFQDALYVADQKIFSSYRALTAIKRYPQNSFVIDEIYKVLFVRRMFQEANEVLSTLLAAEPTNIIARSKRMTACFFLGLKHASLPSVSDMHFARAIREARYVEKHCFIADEEFYGMLGRVYLAKALRDLSAYWEGSTHRSATLESVLESLRQSLACYEKGVVFSPTGRGAQSVFWMIHIKSLLEIVEKNPSAPLDRELQDDQGVYLKNAWEQFVFHGWIEPGKEILFFNRIGPLMAEYGNSSNLSSILPYFLYSVAAFLHDMAPVLTVMGIKQVVAYMQEAERAAKKVPSHVGLYSIGGCWCLVQSRQEFLECNTRALGAVREKYAKYLESAPDDQIIPMEDRMGLRLCLINLNRMPGFDPLFEAEEVVQP